MIKTAGADVAPHELEHLLQSFDEVQEAGVLGLPDPERGQEGRGRGGAAR